MAASPDTDARETIEQRLHRTGIARLGSLESGFRYRRPDGTRPTRGDLARIAALVIPPAWRDVRIASTAGNRVQAIGRDQRGRLQYRYHEAQHARRERAKLERILRFAAALPRLRARVDRDLRRRGLVRERVLAAVVRILGSCLLRPGSASYAKENGSFGIATLRPRHVRTNGATIVFAFPAKSGKRHRAEMRDARVARVVRELLDTGAREVFAYERPRRARPRGGREPDLVDVRRRDLNAYLEEAAGERISAKDFRTWPGTLVCAASLARGAGGTSPAGRRRGVAAALRATANLLGNTPAVCRRSYVFGAVLGAYERGRTVRATLDGTPSLLSDDPGTRRLERAVLKLLRARRSGRAH